MALQSPTSREPCLLCVPSSGQIRITLVAYIVQKQNIADIFFVGWLERLLYKKIISVAAVLPRSSPSVSARRSLETPPKPHPPR
mmetsp:Transcript_21344/g.52548  ORF Transcript_21344/g.52548 Transcript_21344/m.52548 type:complete len:84 (-) Transcript_21344:1-252(-)